MAPNKKSKKNVSQGQGSDPDCPYCRGKNKHGIAGRKACKSDRFKKV